MVFVARDIPDAEHLLEEVAFFAPDLQVNILPEWDVLPYDMFSPTAEVVADRVTALTGLLDDAPGVTVVTAAALLSPAPPPEFFAARAFHLRVGGRLNLQSLQERLLVGGYARVERVLESGEFAVYGGQADVFPPDAERPFRLVLLDDEIEQIRIFDPTTQRSTGRVDALRTLPMSECDLSDAGLARFRAAYAERFGRGGEEFRRGVLPPGGEFFLPLFFEQEGRVFDYIRADGVVVARAGLNDIVTDFLHQTRQRQKLVSVYEERPALPATTLFMREDEFYRRLRAFSLVELTDAAADDLPPVAVNRRSPDPHRALIECVKNFDGKIIIAVDGKGRRDALATLITAGGTHATVCENFAEALSADSPALVVAPLRGGFALPAARLVVLSEAEIFESPPSPRARRRQRAARVDAGDIRPGDLVVHRQYGVGRAQGLKHLTAGGESGEFFEIEYADSQRLWLPVSQLHMLDIHHGGAELSKMGGAGWRRAHRRAARHAHDAAARLLEINARRAAAAPRRHRPDETMMAKFIGNFAYPETPDQDRAAAEVLADLRGGKPMDRLIAADVGFGKTEIAMRAAAAAVFAGSQAAVLAPTTLLAEQHYRVFSDRFADFPARIERLTRLVPLPARRQTLAGLASGVVDIVIGTHALLQKSVRYKNLGLAVIDEEHRFGVSHKERFKNALAGVDLLSMSATPIPRTLAMALGGLRDMSIIATPPPARLAVKTLVTPFSHSVVAEACERELRRGGQVFFIHNEIRDIDEMAKKLAAWLPRARLLTAHGGMTGERLEGTMRRFLRRDADILLCTTIVESGLDIANANTIIINRADRMGLSRLHQLRGRVGRAGAQAYAYFLTPAEFEPLPAAVARLSAAKAHGAPGGGFSLAMRDLEMRGAGEVLGEKQSGDMEAVGYATYQRMVAAAARQLRGEAEIESDISAAVSPSAAALLPPKYVPAPGERMRYYRRLAAAETDDAVESILQEWGDRFGAPPPPACLLAESHRLRLAARAVAVESVRIEDDGAAKVKFCAAPPCAEKLLQKTVAGECRATSPNTITLSLATREPLEQARRLLEFLRSLRS